MSADAVHNSGFLFQLPELTSMTTILSLKSKETHLAVVGLGYVGLPLAVALNRYFSVYGLDTDSRRIQELRAGIDPTRSATARDLRGISQQLTTTPEPPTSA